MFPSEIARPVQFVPYRPSSTSYLPKSLSLGSERVSRSHPLTPYGMVTVARQGITT